MCRNLFPDSQLCAGLQQIVTNFSKTAEGISGPVAIVAVGSEIAKSDLSGLFQFAAIVNINLAVVNALPLPALDGGFLALLLAEAVRGESWHKSTAMLGSNVTADLLWFWLCKPLLAVQSSNDSPPPLFLKCCWCFALQLNVSGFCIMYYLGMYVGCLMRHCL